MSRERGSALVIAVLIMAVLTLLGMSYLLLADTENKIAENERLSAQTLYFAEGVTREVKRWFDRPPYSAGGDRNLVKPTTAVMVRVNRLIDRDGAGPADDPPVPADGTTDLPYYKVGVDIDHDGNDDIFDKPYRSGLSDMFVGTEDGPDILMDRATDAATATFLDTLAEKIMPGFPAGAAGVLARVKTIELYAPPYLDAGGGNWVRYGMATVSARVQILRNPGAADEQIMADRTVTTVLNEAPYGGAFGPLHSCDELAWDNAFRVYWGAATAATTGNLPVTPRNGMSRSIPRDLPPTPKVDTLDGHLSPAGDATWSALKTAIQGQTIEDPWFRFFAGLDVENWSASPSPQPFPPLGGAYQDLSNRFQNYPNVPCPDYNYATWKAIAKSGGSDVHYYAWDAPSNGSKFRENGTGPATEFQVLTNGKSGLFFFDTRDGLAPHDFDAGNVAANLTPEIRITDAGYGTRGFVYVNTKLWSVSGAPGRPATFTFPGEPFRDLNENGIWESGEDWINMQYGSFSDDIDTALVVDELDEYDPSIPPPSSPAPVWNRLGPSVTHDAVVWGILYVAGQFRADGTPFYNGSVITYAGTETGVKTPGTASLYWDPRVKEQRPPPEWNLPRVIITGWQTGE